MRAANGDNFRNMSPRQERPTKTRTPALYKDAAETPRMATKLEIATFLVAFGSLLYPALHDWTKEQPLLYAEDGFRQEGGFDTSKPSDRVPDAKKEASFFLKVTNGGSNVARSFHGAVALRTVEDGAIPDFPEERMAKSVSDLAPGQHVILGDADAVPQNLVRPGMKSYLVAKTWYSSPWHGRQSQNFCYELDPSFGKFVIVDASNCKQIAKN